MSLKKFIFSFSIHMSIDSFKKSYMDFKISFDLGILYKVDKLQSQIDVYFT